jgi:putative oxygen-independent coproporphyrinogen III oxidase
MASKPSAEALVNATCSEIAERVDSCVTASLKLVGHGFENTLYIGGGTPSLLSADQIAALAEAVRRRYGVSAFDEFTVEANPDDIAGQGEYLLALRKAGVNRLSMGVQSFDDAHLKFMNRRHSSAEAVAAFREARTAGFTNISLDLIFGYGGLTLESWRHDIEELVALKPEHVSCYQMSVEPDSALEKLKDSGRYAELTDDECADQYALMQSMLAAAGYQQYEVSNFCLPGFWSRHNSSYWARTPYVGYGPAAHSFDGDRLRRWNLSDLRKYLSSNASQERFGFETLSDDDIFNEQIMLGLRRTCGLDLCGLDAVRLASVRPEVDSLLASGMLVPVGRASASGYPTETDIVRIPPSKLFVSDLIMEDLFV